MKYVLYGVITRQLLRCFRTIKLKIHFQWPVSGQPGYYVHKLILNCRLNMSLVHQIDMPIFYLGGNIIKSFRLQGPVSQRVSDLG